MGGNPILVVEDKSSEREALARVLRLEDYEVLTASGCDEADVYLEEPIDLVVSDVEMPKVDGFELTRRIRGHAELEHTGRIDDDFGTCQRAAVRGVDEGDYGG